MKTVYLAIFLLSCASAPAKSLVEANVPEDLGSILKGYHLVLGESSWRTQQRLSGAGADVSYGSSYCTFTPPSPEPADYMKLAQEVRDAFMGLYGLKCSRTGGHGSPTNRFGGADGTWYDMPDPANSKESISVFVRAMPLRDAQIGILISYIRVRPPS